MRQNDKSRLTHILESAEEIQQWFSGKSKEEIDIDKMMQKAAAKNIEIIGEATKNISEALRTRYREVPWKDMAGARDVLTHEFKKAHPKSDSVVCGLCAGTLKNCKKLIFL